MRFIVRQHIIVLTNDFLQYCHVRIKCARMERSMFLLLWIIFEILFIRESVTELMFYSLPYKLLFYIFMYAWKSAQMYKYPHRNSNIHTHLGEGMHVQTQKAHVHPYKYVYLQIHKFAFHPSSFSAEQKLQEFLLFSFQRFYEGNKDKNVKVQTIIGQDCRFK